MRGFTRKRAERQTFPEHLPRERVVIEPPTACDCCGGNRLRKLGEDVIRTLEVVTPSPPTLGAQHIDLHFRRDLKGQILRPPRKLHKAAFAGEIQRF